MLKNNYENNSIEFSTLYIITPVYNEANNLDRLVSSFREMQKDFEAEYCVKFILVDDGSNDNTLPKLLSLQSTDKRIKLVQEILKEKLTSQQLIKLQNFI